jgi:phosphate-selective porin OprO and OprP
MKTFRFALLAGSALLSLVGASPAFAQTTTAEVESLRSEVAALKEQLAALSAKVDAAAAKPAPVAPAPVAVAPPPPATPAKPAIETAFKGAPETSGNGFTFKPRGRIQVDIGSVGVPAAIKAPTFGTATEFRRIYLGAEGTIPGGFGYRVEADLANSAVELTDVWLTYKAGKTTFTLGQQKPFWGLEEMTSDLFTSFQERGAFNSAFGFERRVGVSAAYAGKSVILQGGVFSDNAADLNADTNNSYSFDGRVVFMPKLGKTQLHFGASGHVRDFNDVSATTRYRARPFVHTTDTRLIDTKAFSATGERSFGLEAAAINGPFHATVEGHWITANRPAPLADPTFFGGYGEVGMLLTGGDTSSYKNGAYDRIKPTHPLNKGGMGALLLNARYDYLDLSDNSIIGGTQSTYGLSLIWVPVDYVRFIANYGHLELRDAAVRGTGNGNYGSDAIGLRAQIDF